MGNSRPPIPESRVPSSGWIADPPLSRDIWSSRAQWPYTPTGYVYVPDVFEQVGRALMGCQWTGEAGAFPDDCPVLPRPKMVFLGDTDEIADYGLYNFGAPWVMRLLGIDAKTRALQLTNEEWCRANDVYMRRPTSLDHRAAVHEHIHSEAEAGRIRFYVRHDGTMLPVRREVWNVEHALVVQRLRTGLLNDAPAYWTACIPTGALVPFWANADELSDWLTGDKAAENARSMAAESVSPPVLRDRKRQIEAVAAVLDARGVRKGKVRASHVAELWPAGMGDPPGVKEVLPQMVGKPAGRVARQSN